MNPTNILVATSLVTSLLEQAIQIQGIIQTAQAARTGITSDQLDALVKNYETAKAKLDADIAAAKG